MLEFLFWTAVVIAMIIALVALIAAASKPSAEEVAEKELRRQGRLAREKEESDWISSTSSRFKHCSKGSLVDNPHVSRCLFALDNDQRALRIFGFKNVGKFEVLLDAAIPLSQITSLDVVRPVEKRNFKRKESIPIVTSTKKSPVARGIVGGVLLGPAGLVLGAASGVGRDIKTEVKEHEVWEQKEVSGDPQLYVGTTDPDTPLIKIKPYKASEAEEWLYRLKAASCAPRMLKDEGA